MKTNNTNNDYARALGDLFDKTPKTVLAAIAVSALTTGGERIAEARAEVLREWLVLYQNGIVPQRPPLAACDFARGGNATP